MFLLRRLMLMLIAVVTIAAACGGGGSDSEAGGEVSGGTETTADVPAGTAATNWGSSDRAGNDGSGGAADSAIVVSADGMLRVIPPAGAGEVTVEAAQGIEELDGFGESLRAYELAPDGSTFDDPVELRFELTPAEFTNGVLVAARSSDGTIEPLEFCVEPASDPPVVVASISHFTIVELRYEFLSDITVKAPSRVELEDAVPVELQAEIPENFAFDSASLEVLEGISGEWSADGAVTGSGPDNFVCTSVGTTPVMYSGLIIVDFSRIVVTLRPTEPTETVGWTVQGPVKDASANVECVEAAAEVPIEDTQCRNRTTGEDATGCASVESVTISVDGDSAVINVLVDSSQNEGAAPEVTISLLTNDGPVLIECGEQGCNGFYGPGFERFDPGEPITTTMSDDGFWTFHDVPLSAVGPDAVFDVPSGDRAERLRSQGHRRVARLRTG